MSKMDDDFDPDVLSAFLRDLTALSLKYKIEIAGCGCCHSPYLLHIDDDIGQVYRVGSDGGFLELVPPCTKAEPT